MSPTLLLPNSPRCTPRARFASAQKLRKYEEVTDFVELAQKAEAYLKAHGENTANFKAGASSRPSTAGSKVSSTISTRATSLVQAPGSSRATF